MPANYAVAAQVVDLRTDTPRAAEVFLVDTNVWFWSSYSKAGISLPPHLGAKLIDYPDYLQKCVKCGATLYWCGLTFTELSHQIEKVEREIWNAAEQAAGRPICNPKDFRHNHPSERTRVVREIESAWKAVQSLGPALPAPITIDAITTATALAELRTLRLDGYDLFYVQAARSAGINQIISDDGDFCGVPGILLFTSNQNVINAAGAQGKLLVR